MLTKSLVALSVAAAFLISARSGEQGGTTQQPAEVRTSIVGAPGLPPKIAVPDLISVTNEPETIAAAKEIGAVLWADLAYEREFYMIPRDTYSSIAPTASLDTAPIADWKALGADAVVVGAIRRTASGYTVEFRLLQTEGGKTVMGKQYSGSLNSLKDGGRVYAHTAADDIHQSQRALRGVARTKLLFSSDRDRERMSSSVPGRVISNIYQADYDGANQMRITYTPSIDITPVWAPDRGQIAYTSWRSGYPDIIVQSMTVGRSPQRPARGSSTVMNYLPSWSPDGTKIAFMWSREGNSEIYYMNSDGSDLHRVTNSLGDDVTPTWSPTGQQIAFVSDRTGQTQIYVVNIDGSGLTRLTNETHCDRPTWSPAHFNEIAYTSQSGGGNEIRVYEFATGRTRTITDGSGSNESPAFAPNGRHIAFASDRSGLEQIYVIDRDGKNLRQITKTGRNRFPNWSQ